MSSKVKLILGVILGLIIGIILYFTFTYDEKYFNEVELPKTPYVVNNSNMSYMDTIVAVGIQQLELKPVSVMIKNMTNETRPPNIEGNITEAYIIGDPKLGQYLIFVSNMNREKAIKILAHELVHLKQYETGKIVMNEERSTLTWNGKTYTVDNLPLYENRGWELEAEREAVSLRTKIKSKLYSN